MPQASGITYAYFSPKGEILEPPQDGCDQLKWGGGGGGGRGDNLNNQIVAKEGF